MINLRFLFITNLHIWRVTSSTLLSDVVRNIQFFGLEAQQKVTTSYVVVIGLGGVGSHAASMLLRSGVGRLLLVDFDQVFPRLKHFSGCITLVFVPLCP